MTHTQTPKHYYIHRRRRPSLALYAPPPHITPHQLPSHTFHSKHAEHTSHYMFYIFFRSPRASTTPAPSNKRESAGQPRRQRQPREFSPSASEQCANKQTHYTRVLTRSAVLGACLCRGVQGDCALGTQERKYEFLFVSLARRAHTFLVSDVAKWSGVEHGH